MSRAKKRDAYLRRTYGLTSLQYAHMLKMQQGRCAICRTRPKTRKLHVDHDHKTNVVRGLLCFRCNKLLVGRHTAETAQRVLEYLTRGFDGRQITEAEIAAAIRRRRPALYKMQQAVLSPQVSLGA